MASNKDLSDEILKLDPNAQLDGLNNPKLESLLASLKGAAAPPAPPKPPEEEDVTAKAEAAAKQRAAEQAEANRLREEAVKSAAEGTAEFKVAPGQAITCLRGVVDENQPISAADFTDKEKALADLVSRGAIVKAK